MADGRLIGATLLSGVAAGAVAIFGSSDAANAPTPGVPVVENAVLASGRDQPIAIFHAFDQYYTDVTGFVCELGKQGYSHVQIAPAQDSNPDTRWWARYQPADYSVINGRGTEGELKALVDKAHGCGVRVIADVVFNHMANMDAHRDLNFPGLSPDDFHRPCPASPGHPDGINYEDGNRTTEINCWLGGLPDLDQGREAVRRAHEGHIDKLLALGVDGFRFDAAKHMPPDAVRHYIEYANERSDNSTWNYFEVIEDHDTNAGDYSGFAAVTDFDLYHSMKTAFTLGGDLKSLRVPHAVPDPRSVTFGRNHDNIREINDNAIDPYADRTDSYLATAYVLAHESGTPLVLNWDSADVGFIRAGVQFRSILRRRAISGSNVKENVLAAIDSTNLLVMERGGEGWFIENKAVSAFDTPALDLTLTNLEGCYRELRNGFTVAVERRPDGKKWVTRWGTASRGGMHVEGRDALYLVRDPWEKCQGS